MNVNYHTGAVFETFTEAYESILRTLLQYGEESSPRGMKTREIPGFVFSLTDSRNNLLVSHERNLQMRYAVAEWLWISFGRNDSSITSFNRHLIKFSDDGRVFAGAYGPRLIEQWEYARTSLQNEGSRQAVISIWTPRPRASADIPCTLTLQFLLRDNRLHMIVNMRSNDAWLGLPYDVYSFTQLQATMAQQLGVATGWYQHHVGSMHLYEEHADSADWVVKELKWGFKNMRQAMSAVGRSPLPPPPAISMEERFLSIANGNKTDDMSKWADYTMMLQNLKTGHFKDLAVVINALQTGFNR